MNLYPLLVSDIIAERSNYELGDNALLDCSTVGNGSTGHKPEAKWDCEDLDRMLGELETMSQDEARQLLAENNTGSR
jgi:hypothetical protein